MEKNGQAKRFLIEFKILYTEEQKEVIDRFVEYCKVHGYNRVAGILTLLEWADYMNGLSAISMQVSDLAKKVMSFEEGLKEPVQKPLEPPKTMGQCINTPVKK